MPDSGTAAPSDSLGLLIRGRLRPDTVILEPAFRTGLPSRAPAEANGPHRLRGEDPDGSPVLDVAFHSTPVADLPDGPEEHFSLHLPLPAAEAARIHRIEVETADGLTAHRSAGMTEDQLRAALEGAVRAQVHEEGRARVHWDSQQFPWVMIRHPETGRILAFAREGEATVRTDASQLVVILSEGVRSASRTVPVEDPR